jgi:hypothetical protein
MSIPEHPFRPGETPEEYERWETYTPLIAQKQAECQALQQNMVDARSLYYAAPAGERDAELDTWSYAEDAYNACLDEVDHLISYRDYGGGPTLAEWPQEVPAPTVEPVMEGIPTKPLYRGRF